MKTCADKFHETFKDVHFENDIPWHVWNDAWGACLEECAAKLERRAQMFLNGTNNSLIAHELIGLAEELRGKNEDNQQTRTTGDDSQRPEKAYIL